MIDLWPMSLPAHIDLLVIFINSFFTFVFFVPSVSSKLSSFPPPMALASLKNVQMKKFVSLATPMPSAHFPVKTKRPIRVRKMRLRRVSLSKLRGIKGGRRLRRVRLVPMPIFGIYHPPPVVVGRISRMPIHQRRHLKLGTKGRKRPSAKKKQKKKKTDNGRKKKKMVVKQYYKGKRTTKKRKERGKKEPTKRKAKTIMPRGERKEKEREVRETEAEVSEEKTPKKEEGGKRGSGHGKEERNMEGGYHPLKHGGDRVLLGMSPKGILRGPKRKKEAVNWKRTADDGEGHFRRGTTNNGREKDEREGREREQQKEPETYNQEISYESDDGEEVGESGEIVANLERQQTNRDNDRESEEVTREAEKKPNDEEEDEVGDDEEEEEVETSQNGGRNRETEEADREAEENEEDGDKVEQLMGEGEEPTRRNREGQKWKKQHHNRPSQTESDQIESDKAQSDRNNGGEREKNPRVKWKIRPLDERNSNGKRTETKEKPTKEHQRKVPKRDGLVDRIGQSVKQHENGPKIRTISEKKWRKQRENVPKKIPLKEEERTISRRESGIPIRRQSGTVIRNNEGREQRKRKPTKRRNSTLIRSSEGRGQTIKTIREPIRGRSETGRNNSLIRSNEGRGQTIREPIRGRSETGKNKIREPTRRINSTLIRSNEGRGKTIREPTVRRNSTLIRSNERRKQTIREPGNSARNRLIRSSEERKKTDEEPIRRRSETMPRNSGRREKANGEITETDEEQLIRKETLDSSNDLENDNAKESDQGYESDDEEDESDEEEEEESDESDDESSEDESGTWEMETDSSMPLERSSSVHGDRLHSDQNDSSKSVSVELQHHKDRNQIDSSAEKEQKSERNAKSYGRGQSQRRNFASDEKTEEEEWEEEEEEEEGEEGEVKEGMEGHKKRKRKRPTHFHRHVHIWGRRDSSDDGNGDKWRSNYDGHGTTASAPKRTNSAQFPPLSTPFQRLSSADSSKEEPTEYSPLKQSVKDEADNRQFFDHSSASDHSSSSDHFNSVSSPPAASADHFSHNWGHFPFQKKSAETESDNGTVAKDTVDSTVTAIPLPKKMWDREMEREKTGERRERWKRQKGHQTEKELGRENGKKERKRPMRARERPNRDKKQKEGKEKEKEKRIWEKEEDEEEASSAEEEEKHGQGERAKEWDKLGEEQKRDEDGQISRRDSYLGKLGVKRVRFEDYQQRNGEGENGR